MNERRPRLALFIDADNISLQVAPGILARLSADWDVCYRRAYGLNVCSEEEILRAHGIFPIQVLNNSHGKNATDFALVVDAMEELCLGHSDAICLVSADGDFTRLVQRVREKGKRAIVVGKRETADALRNACSEFLAIEDLQAVKAVQETKPVLSQSAARVTKEPAPAVGKGPVPAATKKLAAPAKMPSAETEATVRDRLHIAFQQFTETCKNDALSQFGQFLKKNYPELAPPKFGLSRLKPYLEHIGGFELLPVLHSGGKPPDYRVKLAGSKASRTHGEPSVQLLKIARS